MKLLLKNEDQRSIIRFNTMDKNQILTINHVGLEAAMALPSSGEKPAILLKLADNNVQLLPISISVLASIIEKVEQYKNSKYPIIYHVVDIQKNNVIEHQVAEIGLDKDFNWKLTNGDNITETHTFYADKSEKPLYTLLRFAEWIKETEFGTNEPSEIKH